MTFEAVWPSSISWQTQCFENCIFILISVYVAGYATRPKNLPLINNFQFCSDQANDIQIISFTHELIILTKFHDIRVKIVDFLVIAKYWLSSKFSAYPFT